MLQPGTTSAQWRLIKKLGFRFLVVFFLLYIFLNPNELIPYSYYLHRLYLQPCANVITWLAKDVLHIANPEVEFYNSTIDTAFGYITLLFIFVTAVFASIIWTLIDSKTHNYNRLNNILMLVLRYYLALTWIAYGSLKIVKLQFPSFSPLMLLQTYGNSTPKELAWSFMGYSTGYNYFLGITEYAIGLLLFFRRTSTLGNIIALGVLANVLAFNYNFGVNVKLLSTMLMLMTLFLLSKDITRLVNFFFFNKIVEPVNEWSLRFKTQWKNTMLPAAKYLFMAYVIFFDLAGDMARAKQLGAGRLKPPLYGIYSVVTFIRNKDTLPPLTSDTGRWGKLVVLVPAGNASIMQMDNSFTQFVFKPDTTKGKIEMYTKTDTANKYTFTYSRRADSVLVLQGKWHRDSLEIKLREENLQNFRLINSGFRWVKDRNKK